MAAASKLTKRLIEDGLAPTRRIYGHTGLRAMAAAEGYVMVRRPGSMPFVMSEADWRALPEQERAA